MKILVRRLWERPDCIMGVLYIDGVYACYTLELPREFEGAQNVPQKTCILDGVYDLIRVFSQRHQCDKPELAGVLGRSGIQIDIANEADQLLGCIAVGESRVSDTVIGNSRGAYEDLWKKLSFMWDAGEEITVEVKST